MGKKFFYTYSNTYKGRAFIRGYLDGQRFDRVYGGMPYDKSQSDEYKQLSNKNFKFVNFEEKIYVSQEQYANSGTLIDLILSSIQEEDKLHGKYEKNISDKVDIYGKKMIEYTLPLRNMNTFLMKLKENNIDTYNNIDSDIKIIEKLKRMPNFEIDYNQIKIGFIDIEIEMEHGGMKPEVATERINVITLKLKGGKIYTWCLGDYHSDMENLVYKCFDDETEMLKCFINDWREIDLDFISDWNGLAFDIPYIINRICKLPKLGMAWARKLSPFNLINARQCHNKFNAVYTTYDIIGINHLDYLELYLNYSWTPRDSYSLNNICNAEIGKGKLDYSEYGNLHRLYKNNFQKFVDYNIRDVTILEELDDKLKMIHLSMSITYKCCCRFNETSSQIRIWDCYIYEDFQPKNLVLPPKINPDEIERGDLMGGYVKLPTTGIYSNIVSFDVNSLYPTIIRQLNLSPETITDEVNYDYKKETTYDPENDLYSTGALIDCTYDTKWLKERNLCMACSGNLIKRDKQGFLPKMVGDLYNERVKVKKLLKVAKQNLQDVKKEINRRKGEQ